MFLGKALFGFVTRSLAFVVIFLFLNSSLILFPGLFLLRKTTILRSGSVASDAITILHNVNIQSEMETENNRTFTPGGEDAIADLPHLRSETANSLGPSRRIAIVGLYNSGSSILTKILMTLGVRTGRLKWHGSNKTHVHFENLDMKPFLVQAWNQPYGVPSVYTRAQRVQRLRSWIEKEEVTAGGAPVCLKHPLLSLSLDDLLDAWGNETTFVWAHRSVTDSVAALQRRRWFNDPIAASLQAKLWQSLRDFFGCGPDLGGPAGAAADMARCRDHRPLIVSYRDLLDDPRGSVRRIVAALGLSPTTAQVEAAVAAVKPKNRYEPPNRST